MSVFSRLRLVRVLLGAGVALRAALWGAVAAASLLVGGIVVDQASALTPHTRATLLVVAAITAIATAASLAWRDRGVASLERVALWVEEQHPALEYVLITALERGAEPAPRIPSADAWTATALRRVARAIAGPAAAIVTASAILLALPAGAVARIRAPHPGDALERPRREANASRLTPLVARVAPPAYVKRADTTVDEPSDIRALVGSTVTLRGRGTSNGLVAVVGADTLHASSRGDEWSIVMTLGTKAATLRLVDHGDQRLVGLEPVLDQAPSVTLSTPAHDSVLRKPAGRIALAAEANDDYGIAQASFEYIVSSGEGETFTYKSGTLGAVMPRAVHATLSATLSLDALRLKPGDIVHVRAVARDANDATGPGVGTSETRTIRIARVDEYDSVAVDAAAPSDADKGAISERMLITLVEALLKKQSVLQRDGFINESRAIAADQKKLRRQVGDVVFTRLGGSPSGEEQSGDDTPQHAKNMQELLARADSATNRTEDPIDFGGGESPVIAVNKPLLEAYNAMWDAGTALDVGEPATALPHMRRALAAIERARQAERLYLRGQPPAVVIDIAKVRLEGKDKGASSVRRARTASDSTLRALDTRFMRIVALAARAPAAAADSLLVLRIDALDLNAPFAGALGEAAAAIRAGRGTDATSALARARRTLVGVPVARDSLGRWGVLP